jgi:hypothetical protein
LEKAAARSKQATDTLIKEISLAKTDCGAASPGFNQAFQAVWTEL